MIHYTIRKPRNHLTYVNQESLSAKAHNLFGQTLSLKETRTQKKIPNRFTKVYDYLT